MSVQHAPLQKPQKATSSIQAAQSTRSQTAKSPASAALALPIISEVLHSPGRTMDESSRERLGSRFGHDFSKVRIHTDDKAAASADALDAAAYTVGRHIVFGRQMFAPNTASGRGLLAHELAHVVQQRFAEIPDEGIQIGPKDDPLENATDRAAVDVGAGRRIGAQPISAPQLQRAPKNASQTDSMNLPFNKDEYQKSINDAVDMMNGAELERATFVPDVKPLLEELAKEENVEWKDRTGKIQAGRNAIFTFKPLPGTNRKPITLNFKLIVDDTMNPQYRAGYRENVETALTITLFSQKTKTPEQINQALYHECLHLIESIVRGPGKEYLKTGERQYITALSIKDHKKEIDAYRDVLKLLAINVNQRRGAQQSKISDPQIDMIAKWMFEEVMVRAESEIFRFLSQYRETPKPKYIYKVTEFDDKVNLNYVYKALFVDSTYFTKADEANLSESDKDSLKTFQEHIKKYFVDYVQRSLEGTYKTPFEEEIVGRSYQQEENMNAPGAL